MARRPGDRRVTEETPAGPTLEEAASDSQAPSPGPEAEAPRESRIDPYASRRELELRRERWLRMRAGAGSDPAWITTTDEPVEEGPPPDRSD
jgi:hypothetical protein